MKRLVLLCVLASFLFPVMLSGQTASDLNEGSKLEWDSTNAIWHFTWWGRTGRTYFIQQSDDLLTGWTYVNLIEPGENAVNQWGFTTTGTKFFLRLKHTDIPTDDPWNADFDGDGVSNVGELAQGSDPLAWADSNHNDLPDDWELFYFGNVGADPAADPDEDGLTNLQEWQQNSNPIEDAPAGPAAPTGLQSMLVQGGRILLTWIDNSTDENAFRVERRSSTEGWLPVATVASNTTSYTDVMGVRGNSYSYRVVALNYNGWSFSNETAYVVIPNGASPNTITHTYDALGRLIWTTQPNGASTVYRYDANNNIEGTSNVSN
jgi:YD repeat-containing protein